MKVLELALHNGVDPRTGKQLGLQTGEPDQFRTFDDLFAAFRTQLRHFIDIKIRGSRLIERMYADHMPAPFLSVLIDDCIARRARLQRRRRALQQHLHPDGGPGQHHRLPQRHYSSFASPAPEDRVQIRHSAANLPLALSLVALASWTANFAGEEILRQRLLNRTHKYGNDDDYADDLMLQVFNACFEEVDGRPGCARRALPRRDAAHHLPRLFRQRHRRDARRPQGRAAALRGHQPGARRRPPRPHRRHQERRQDGPRQNRRHAAEHEVQLRAWWPPTTGLNKWAHLVRSYFKMDGHHVQFNVVTADTLRKAQADPEAAPRPDRPRRRLQRLFLRSFAGAAGGDHRRPNTRP